MLFDYSSPLNARRSYELSRNWRFSTQVLFTFFEELSKPRLYEWLGLYMQLFLVVREINLSVSSGLPVICYHQYFGILDQGKSLVYDIPII